MQLITVTDGTTSISTPNHQLALQVLAEMGDKATPMATASCAPPIGMYWPGEGGVNGGLFPGGDKPYYLIVPTGSDAEGAHKWGGYGDELSGAGSAWDGQANTADLVGADSSHPAAQYCAAFERDGHKDFYLMARREASFLEITLPEVFTKAYHWTSTQRSADNAYYMDFEDGWLFSSGKSYERLARPVRRKFI